MLQPVRRVVERVPMPRNSFVVQMFSRGGARICTPSEEAPLLETVIQPDGDVIVKVWRDADKWDDRVTAQWAEHEKKVKSTIHRLRWLRFALQKLSYLSVVPTVWGLYSLFSGPFSGKWLHVLAVYGLPLVVLLVAKPAIGVVFRMVVNCAARQFTSEEWNPPRRENQLA